MASYCPQLFRAVLAFGLVICFTFPAHADDWPNWRGPNHDGISSETQWNSDWSKAKPKVAWRAKVGLGFSSVAVADGRLYTIGHQDGNEFIFCLNAETGKEIWSKNYPCNKIARFYEGGSSSTPSVDGDRVYTVGKEGQFHCYDAANGKLHWGVDLKKELDSPVPEWGFACSPLIQGDHVIIQAARIAAYDKKTGKKLWESEQFKQGYGTPAAFEFKGKPCLAVLNNKTTVVLDASSGKTLASTPLSTLFDTNSTTPIVVGDTIFISTGYGKGCALFRFTGTSLDEIYTKKTMANHMNNCVLHEGHLYGFHGNSNRSRFVELRCIDLKTGTLKWSERGLGCGSLMLSDGKLIVMSDEGNLVLVQASSKSYKEIGRMDSVVKGRSWTTPILANGRIYCRSSPGDLACVDVRIPKKAD